MEINNNNDSVTIIRQIDKVRRLGIPKSFLRALNISEGDEMDITIINDGIFIKKHADMNKNHSPTLKLCAETTSSIIGVPVAISDMERIIAASGLDQLPDNEPLSSDLKYIIETAEKNAVSGVCYLTDNSRAWTTTLVCPIVSVNNEKIGAVMYFFDEGYERQITDQEAEAAINIAKLIADLN